MSQNHLKENKMGVMPVGKLLVNMATPIILSMLVTALYNVVDSIYVAHVSESAVTALSLAFPIQNLQIAAALGIGVGVNASLSKSLGEKNQEAVNRAAGNGIFLACCCTVIFAIFGFFGSRPYFLAQSQVKETLESGISYTSICCIFSLGLFLEILGERLLQASGRTVFTLISQGLGSVINIILDPIFIFGWLGLPPMGVAGAAIATVIGQWAGAAISLGLNFKFNHDVHFHIRYLKPVRSSVGPILAVGLPTFIMNGISSVMTFGLNQILQGFQETATGVLGVYLKLQSFCFMPLFGINNAIISIVAYNYGAKKPERIMKSLKIAVSTALLIMVTGAVVFGGWPQVLLGMFKPSENFLAIGCTALRIISLSFPLAAPCVILSACFQALGKGTYSAIVSLSRQLIVLLPVAYLLSLSGNLDLVWWSYPIAEVMSFSMTAFLFIRIYRARIKPIYQELREAEG